jgi:hypothetical protein
MKIHISYCNDLGFFIIFYIDDMRCVAKSFEECEKFFQLAMSFLAKAGWLVKAGKGIWVPTQKGEFLGLVHDLIKMYYYVPEKKLENILEAGRWLLTQKKVKVRSLASFYGKIAACQLALGPTVSLLSRVGHQEIGEGSDISLNFFLRLTDEIKVEIKTMIDLIPQLNGFPIHQRQALAPSRVLSTDASASRLAGLEVKCNGMESNTTACSASCADSLVIHRRFDAFELQQSSTYRELVALWELYFLRVGAFKGQSVLHQTDNQNVPGILTKGSGNPLLQSMAIDIFKACHKKQVSLYAQWVPRTHPHLLLPDYYSRKHDLSDWGMDNEAMDILLKRCPFELKVDLFASEHNARLPTFFSKNACPSAAGINAFCFCWETWSPGLCVPPPDLIVPVIKHIVECKSKGLMIIPLWRAADFWTEVCPDGRHVNSIFFDGSKGKLGMVSAPHINKVFSGIPSFDMLYLLYDGEIPDPNVSHPIQRRCVLNGCSLCLT